MYHTDLGGRLREYGTDGIRKSILVVGTGNQYILHSTGFQIRQDTHPERRTLRFSDPHAKNLFQAVLLQTDTKIDGLVYDLPVIPYLEDDTVHPDYQINRVQRTVLPFLGRWFTLFVMMEMADVESSIS